jgi:sialic acid synthase SpsE
MVFVIAELCSNAWPYNPAKLSSFIQAAGLAGADAVKVQLFQAEHFPPEEFDAKAKLEFPRERLPTFIDEAHFAGMSAGASVFDVPAIDSLVEAGADFIKLATREQFTSRLIYKSLETGLRVIRSVDWAGSEPQRYANETLLGCVPEYPTKTIWGLPLNRLGDLGGEYGWSSHTTHWIDVLDAVQNGATVIEKHFAMSENDPEAEWSLFPEQFKTMVEEIRRIESRENT